MKHPSPCSRRPAIQREDYGNSHEGRKAELPLNALPHRNPPIGEGRGDMHALDAIAAERARRRATRGDKRAQSIKARRLRRIVEMTAVAGVLAAISVLLAGHLKAVAPASATTSAKATQCRIDFLHRVRRLTFSMRAVRSRRGRTTARAHCCSNAVRSVAARL